MKTFTKIFLLVAVLLIFLTGISFSQSGTMTIYANSSSTLDQIINGDVTNGVQNHSVYQLVSTDTSYLVDATITIKSSVSIIGVPDPSTGRLPCIQSDVLADKNIPGIQFTFTGSQTQIMFQNLYLLGVATNNLTNTESGQGVQISADSVSFIVDNCVFDDFTQFDIGYNGNWDKFKITNTKFRNGVEVATAYYIPEALRNLYPNTAPTDSVIFKYNTFLCVASGPVVPQAIITYFEFSHNSMVIVPKAPVWTERLTDAKIDNNIFYNTYAITENQTEYYGLWDEKGTVGIRKPAIINYVPLDSLTAALFMGKAITTPEDSVAAETARTVEVKNNLYFWSSDLTTFYKNWNDTTQADTLYVPEFMNPQTTAIFGSAEYPNFSQSGNQNVDPGFGTGISNVMNNPTAGDGNGYLGWMTLVRQGTGTNSDFFAYQRTDGTALSPTWPLPEYTSGDLKYSANLTAPDGMPYGDPYWFTGKITGVENTNAQLPDKFSLSEAYPNPFNPTTNINFTISKPGIVSLKVYNTLGQLVQTLVNNQYKQAGDYNLRVDMSSFASGVYLYRLEEGNNAITKKMVLLK